MSIVRNPLFEPLLNRNLNEPIAYLQSQCNQGNEPLACISVGTFLAQVQEVATQLPEGQYALNLCGNRYFFMLAFCAVIVKHQTNLLPPNRHLATQASLSQRYPGTYVIHDTGQERGFPADGLDLAPDLPSFNISHIDLNEVTAKGRAFGKIIPTVSLDHLCAITFTSGSTGDSKPNNKTWRVFRESSLINVRYMVPALNGTMAVLATVPGQHMWGLESSVLNALFSPLAVSDTRMLYPKDIQRALAALPEPRMLISTPVHLRALVNSGLRFPAVARILCATAPLESELAQRVEEVFAGELREVYGCSEVGSMACRKTSVGEPWWLFDGLTLEPYEDATIASAAHLPAPVKMQDVMTVLENNRFNLRGRHADMVEIAGKRGSLQEINRVLLSIPEVDDGIIFLPKDDERHIPRLVGLVVMSADIDKKVITNMFRQTLDAAFIPRPIYRVDALPREENGKLTRAAVDRLYTQIKRKV